MEKEFCLEEYLHRAAVPAVSAEKDNMAVFEQICRIVEAEFDKEWQETDDEAKNRKLNREKKAIMGFEEETAFYKEKIREILREVSRASPPRGGVNNPEASAVIYITTCQIIAHPIGFTYRGIEIIEFHICVFVEINSYF